MKRALITLTPSASAVFSERAATEGEHHTLGAPNGASLLGWAARAYDDFGAHAYQIFHSGKVRFSNALPLFEDGAVAWPMPQLIAEAKHARGGLKDRRLQKTELRVGRLKGDHAQFEPLKKTLFVGADGRVIAPELGGRLRTAMAEGRAERGRLFGYEHIDPARARYVASLEADDLDGDAWKDLKRRFDGQTLALGRAKGAYGGGYVASIPTLKEGDPDPWPTGAIAEGATRVRVWALSDLALAHPTTGAPVFAPRPEWLGLPKSGSLLGADCAIGVRRYAPWNKHLGCRDLERQVITAGSVLSFEYREGATGQEGPGIVGLFREAGLGRIWVAPPLLAGEPGEHPTLAERGHVVSSSVDAAAGGEEGSLDDLDRELLDWLETRPRAA